MSLVRLVEHLSERLNSIVSADDTDAYMNGSEYRYVEPLPDSRQASVSLHSMLTLCVVGSLSVLQQRRLCQGVSSR